jgi:hypothetical protein
MINGSSDPAAVFDVSDLAPFKYSKFAPERVYRVPVRAPITARRNCMMKVKMMVVFIFFSSLENLYFALALFCMILVSCP